MEGLTTLSLLQATLVIHIFVEGHRKKISNVFDSKPNCMSFNSKKNLVGIDLKMDISCISAYN
jgi:hypothetical protein